MENALIRVYKLNQGEIVYENFFVTNEDGKTVNIPLYAPDIILSLEEENDIRPYETYNVELRLKGYEIEEIQNVQIFADETSYLPMHPAPSRRQVFPGRTVSVITDHHLLTNYGGNNQGQTPANNGRIRGEVIIPTYITVHLGRPDSNAENITVPFLYYLKNVASSEIYPTWPVEALKANINDAMVFGPFLIVNGKPLEIVGDPWGYAPRVAIGQTKSGIILFLVVDGENYINGASLQDMVDILTRYGAYNAANLDGGQSSSLSINGKLYNNPPAAAKRQGGRYVVTGWGLIK